MKKEVEAAAAAAAKAMMPPPAKIPAANKPFKCSECNKGFFHQMKLVKHVNKKHKKNKKKGGAGGGGKKPVNNKQLKMSPMGCPDCEKSFSNMDELTAHFSSNPHSFQVNYTSIANSIPF